jgi:hypothetical protein
LPQVEYWYVSASSSTCQTLTVHVSRSQEGGYIFDSGLLKKTQVYLDPNFVAVSQHTCNNLKAQRKGDITLIREELMD